MIEISFWKILIVLVVALIVLGPEQLPKVATSLGRMVSKLKKVMATTQQSLELIADKTEKKPEAAEKEN